MSKPILKYALLLCGILAFSACGKKKENNENENKQLTTAQQQAKAAEEGLGAQLKKIGDMVLQINQRVSKLEQDTKSGKAKKELESLREDMDKLTKAMTEMTARNDAKMKEWAETINKSIEDLDHRLRKIEDQTPGQGQKPIPAPEPEIDLSKELAEIRAAINDLYSKIKAAQSEEETSTETQETISLEEAKLAFAKARAEQDQEKTDAAIEVLRKMKIPLIEIEASQLDKDGKLQKIDGTNLVEILKTGLKNLEAEMAEEEFDKADEELKKEMALQVEWIKARLEVLGATL